MSSENSLKEPTEKPLKKKCGEEEEIKSWHSLEINPGPLACATSALNIYEHNIPKFGQSAREGCKVTIIPLNIKFGVGKVRAGLV